VVSGEPRFRFWYSVAVVSHNFVVICSRKYGVSPAQLAGPLDLHDEMPSSSGGMASKVTTSPAASSGCACPLSKPSVVDNHGNSDGPDGQADNNMTGVEMVMINGKPIPINEINVREGKGDFIGGGATGLVERLKSGDVVKSPWTGRPTESDCKREMAIEAQIYQRLGAHTRLVQLKHWDPFNYVLTRNICLAALSRSTSRSMDRRYRQPRGGSVLWRPLRLSSFYTRAVSFKPMLDRTISC